MSVDLQKTNAEWEHLGASDPLWAVLTDPSKRGGAWDERDFFEAGRIEVTRVIEFLYSEGSVIPVDGTAIDFGCGVGRLSQALSDHIGNVIGIDCSPSMLRKAKELCTKANIRWIHNDSNTLRGIDSDSIDFLYSSIVLQHMPSENALVFISEFGRVLRPGASMLFQIPVARRTSLKSKIKAFTEYARCHIAIRSRMRSFSNGNGFVIERNGGTQPIIRMYTTNADRVKRAVDQSGCVVSSIGYTNQCDLDFNGNLKIEKRPFVSEGFLSMLVLATKSRGNDADSHVE